MTERISAGRGGNDNEGRLLVYTMGKVGSSTIFESLKKAATARQIHHVHYLTTRGINHTEAYIRSSCTPRMPEHLQAGKMLRAEMDEGRTAGWKLITLVREPVARNISNYFENIHLWFPKFRKRWNEGTVCIDEIIDYFLNNLQHTLPMTWFDCEMKEAFGIDVYATKFPVQKGYEIYKHHNRPDLLLLRLEDISRCSAQAFKEFLDLDDFCLVDTNVSRNKGYNSAYKKFVDTIKLPGSFIDQMYDSKYAMHFYSAEEIERFQAKWSNFSLKGRRLF